MSVKLVFGPQGEPIFVPASLDDDPDLQPTMEYGQKLLQKLQQDYKPELVGNISGQSFPESASLAATPLFNEHGVNPSAVLVEAYAVADAEGLLADGWKIELANEIVDDGQLVYGTCNPATKTITLSVRKMTSVAEARDTYIHELSHACQTRHHGTAFEAVLHELRHKHNRID